MVQHFRSTTRRVRAALLSLVCLSVSAPASAGLYEDFLRAADAGECLENVTYRMVQRLGPAKAGGVVAAALRALSAREREQRGLGCDGDIATQAIAAGADPDDVLEATAAGL